MFFKLLLPSIVLFSGAETTAYLATNDTNTIGTTKPKPTGYPVSTQKVYRQDHQLTFHGFGTIQARETVTLSPQISGEISATKDLIETGSYVAKDDLLFSIDPRELEIELASVTADLVKAKEELKLEQGRQLIAQHEWLSLDAETKQLSDSTSLALRQPQLKSVRAEISKAQSKVDLAQLNLERSRITAPCNGVILEEKIAVGNTVSPGDIVVTLACSDYYTINTSFPVSYINYLDIPQNGKSKNNLTVRSAGTERDAIMTSLLPDVEKNVQMARVLVHVEKPLEQPQLLLGAHAEVEIPAKKMENVFVIPASTLKQNNTIWILSDDSTLEIRTVQPELTNNGQVIIRDDLSDGDQIITSPLPLPVEGMFLRVQD